MSCRTPPSQFFLQPSAAAAAAAAAAFPNPAASVVSEYVPGATYVALGANLQNVINAADPGDTIRLSQGLYTQNISIDKHLKLIGAGSGSDPAKDTILHPTSGNVVVITGSGVSNSDPILLKNLRVETTGSGLALTCATPSFVRFENVQVTGDASRHDENEMCLRVD